MAIRSLSLVLLAAAFTAGQSVPMIKPEPELAVASALGRERVAVGFLVRDGQSYLERNLRALDHALTGFLEVRFYYMENDSLDRTRQIIRSFGENHSVTGRHLQLGGPHTQKLCKQQKKEYNCGARLRVLASLRQKLLDLVLAWKLCTLVLLVDLDCVSFEVAGLRQLFVFHRREKADACFGQSVHIAIGGKCMYDYGAIKPWTNRSSGDGGLGLRVPLRHLMRPRNSSPDASAFRDTLRHIAHGEVVRVRSAFSGFGLYSAAALRSTSAAYDLNPTDFEHVGLNGHLALLLVNSSFQPEYGEKNHHCGFLFKMAKNLSMPRT